MTQDQRCHNSLRGIFLIHVKHRKKDVQNVFFLKSAKEVVVCKEMFVFFFNYHFNKVVFYSILFLV